nr:hypothetical protein [Polyangium fumosum]
MDGELVPTVNSLMKQRAVFGLMLVILVSSGCIGCKPDHRHGGAEKGEESKKATLGEVRIGEESVEFYTVHGFDFAILGFSVSTGAGPTRYFPIFASTNRGVPSVVLEVFTSKSEDEMWVRSSWSVNEILAYHQIGAETAITQWGEIKFLKEPMPDHLSGGSPGPRARKWGFRGLSRRSFNGGGSGSGNARNVNVTRISCPFRAVNVSTASS